MKVMTLLGSPRKRGNTAQVLGYVEEALKAGGHEVDPCWMNDYAVAGRQGGIVQCV